MRQETQHNPDLLPVPYQSPAQAQEAREASQERRYLSGMIGVGIGGLVTLTILYPEPAGYVWAFLGLSTVSVVIFRQVVQEIEKMDATPSPGIPVSVADISPGDFASREEYEAFQKTSRYTAGEDVIKEETEAYLAEQARQEAGRVPDRMARVDERIELEINKTTH